MPSIRLSLMAAAGLAICCLGSWQYYRYGFSTNLWLYWLAGLALAAAAARLADGSRARRHGWPWRDCRAILLLAAFFAPLYLYGVHDLPRQMNTDEIAIMTTEKQLAAGGRVDIFGPSFYSGLPAMIFWAFGKLGVLLGGVNLGHMRLIHAASGVVVILLCFVLMRLLGLPRPAAVAGAAVLACNHSFFIISRSAMRDNTAVLLELAALICLWQGWQRRSYSWTLGGGIIGGLTAYTYYPSRITMVVWLAFMVLNTAAGRFREWRPALGLTALSLATAAVIIVPLVIADSRTPLRDPYPDQQFLWQAAARQQEKQYRYVSTTREAVEINIRHGLAAFNQPYVDEGAIYNHPGYGFNDRITGVLLWLGVASIVLPAIGRRRRRLSQADLFGLSGFCLIWLSLALLLTRAPDYTRMLIVLPFVGYMVGRFVVGLSGLLAPALRRLHQKLLPAAPYAISAAIVVSVAIANGFIVRDYVRLGQLQGDGVGDTLRFQEQHAAEYAAWLYVYQPGDQYFYWGKPAYWQSWLSFAKADTQPLQMLTVDQLQSGGTAPLSPGEPCYLLTTSSTWRLVQGSFSQRETVLAVQPLDGAGSRVAVKYQDPLGR